MELNRAEELMQKQINCAKETMEQTCFHRACSCCVNYMGQEEEQELRVIALHIMQAWTGAKNEILKTCGCRTAFDIMEKWEAKTDGREGTD